jgi:predicted aconitase
MSYQNKKIVGIWMDNKQAFILSTPDRKIGGAYQMLKKIERKTHTDENYKNERFELAKETQELKQYYKALTAEIDQDDAIYIFGPGKSQEEFKNILKEIHQFKSKDIVLGSSDRMTTKEMAARVKEHFEGN